MPLLIVQCKCIQLKTRDELLIDFFTVFFTGWACTTKPLNRQRSRLFDLVPIKGSLIKYHFFLMNR